MVLAPQHILWSPTTSRLMCVPFSNSGPITLLRACSWLGCFGAAVEISLNCGSVIAQFFDGRGGEQAASRGEGEGGRRDSRPPSRLGSGGAGPSLLASSPFVLQCCQSLDGRHHARRRAPVPLVLIILRNVKSTPWCYWQWIARRADDPGLPLHFVFIPLEIFGGCNDLVRDTLDNKVVPRTGAKWGRGRQHHSAWRCGGPPNVLGVGTLGRRLALA